MGSRDSCQGGKDDGNYSSGLRLYGMRKKIETTVMDNGMENKMYHNLDTRLYGDIGERKR